MKKIRIIILTGLIAATMLGCKLLDQQEDTLHFYYRVAELSFSGSQTDVIASESRNLSIQRDNLRHLLLLYFHGPLDQNLRAVFPIGTAVTNLETDEDTLIITLDTDASLPQGVDWTVACVCLAKTCFELVDVAQIQIEVADDPALSTLLTRDNVLLSDSILTPTESTIPTEYHGGTT